MSENSLLDQFGKVVIEEVRDRAIRRVTGLLDGTIRSADTQALRDSLSTLSRSEHDAARALAIEAVDSTLHRLMTLIEESDMIEVRITDRGTSILVRESSDGLAGELYSSAGWIARYSKEPHRQQSD